MVYGIRVKKDSLSRSSSVLQKMSRHLRLFGLTILLFPDTDLICSLLLRSLKYTSATYHKVTVFTRRPSFIKDHNQFSLLIKLSSHSSLLTCAGLFVHGKSITCRIFSSNSLNPLRWSPTVDSTSSAMSRFPDTFPQELWISRLASPPRLCWEAYTFLKTFSLANGGRGKIYWRITIFKRSPGAGDLSEHEFGGETQTAPSETRRSWIFSINFGKHIKSSVHAGYEYMA